MVSAEVMILVRKGAYLQFLHIANKSVDKPAWFVIMNRLENSKGLGSSVGRAGD